MQAYDYISKLTKPTAVALGFFDGVHLGHAEIIRNIIDNEALVPTVFTFNIDNKTSFPHNKKNQKLLFSSESRRRFMGELGVEVIIEPSFSQVCDMDGESFIKSVLLDKLNAKKIVCGFDFRFGKNALYTAKDMFDIANKYNIETVIVPPVYYKNKIVSSSLIRKAVVEGNIKEANALLGRPYFIFGEVVHGQKLGRKIGFPTINQDIFSNLLPPKRGVYASAVELDGKIYAGVTNIGIKPTVQSDKRVVSETHIISYQGDLYGKTATVYLLDYLREEEKFPSLKALSKAISKDVYNSEKVIKSEFFQKKLAFFKKHDIMKR